jgi:hypothetical protein
MDGLQPIGRFAIFGLVEKVVGGFSVMRLGIWEIGHGTQNSPKRHF